VARIIIAACEMTEDGRW